MIEGINSLQKENKLEEKAIDISNDKIINSICNIKYNNKEYIFGFFCYLPIPNEFDILPVLITNAAKFKKDNINQVKELIISFYCGGGNKTICIDKSRRIYNSKKYDISIIEIKENDNIDKNIFLDIDEDIYEDNLKEQFEQKSIYLLYHISQSKKIKITLGIIQNINEDNFNIDYTYNIQNISPFGPLINLNNNKLIGINKENESENNLNIGFLINGPIDEFFENKNNDDINEITIIYKNIKLEDSEEASLIQNSEDKISKNKLFGEKFVENNESMCTIIINDEEKELMSFYNIDDLKENEIFEIKLRGINNINNSSFMFYDCLSLISLPDISNWNTIKVTNMSHMFDGCKSLSNIQDISKWNTINVSDMSYMFKDCTSLKQFPDISKWNTENLINVSYIFMTKNLDSNEDIDKLIKNIKPNKIEITDIPQIQEIFISYWGIKGLYEYSEFKRIINQNMSYGYKIRDDLIGFCLMEYISDENIIDVSLICIKKEYTGKHLGESILSFCLDYCKKLNFKTFSLHVSTHNKPAFNLYIKKGFIIKEFIEDYYTDEESGKNSAYYMILND